MSVLGPALVQGSLLCFFSQRNIACWEELVQRGAGVSRDFHCRDEDLAAKSTAVVPSSHPVDETPRELRQLAKSQTARSGRTGVRSRSQRRWGLQLAGLGDGLDWAGGPAYFFDRENTEPRKVAWAVGVTAPSSSAQRLHGAQCPRPSPRTPIWGPGACNCLCSPAPRPSGSCAPTVQAPCPLPHSAQYVAASRESLALMWPERGGRHCDLQIPSL